MNQNTQFEGRNELKPGWPHFWWIISVLLLSVIALISFICTCRMVDGNVISRYVSFASVLLSITLSVFAIFYTYTSNAQIQRHFENINSAAESIKSTSKELISTNTKINESFDNIRKQWGDILGQLSDINKSQKVMESQLCNYQDITLADNLSNESIDENVLSEQGG